MGASNICWILEDFHKLEETEKLKLSQLMKVFMDLSSEHKDLKIVFVGAVNNTARQVIKYDSEMKLRVAEIHVPLMTDSEIRKIVDKGLFLLNIKLNKKEIMKDILHFSNGLASICHKLCLLMCEEKDVYETIDSYASREDIELDYSSMSYALAEYIDGLSDTIKSSFDKALKFKNSRFVIEALASCDKEGGDIDNVFDETNSLNNQLGYDQVREILTELLEEDHGEIFVFDDDSGKYSFNDPFLRSFSLAFFEQSSAYRSISNVELMKLFNKAFSSVKRQYTDLDANLILEIPHNPLEEEVSESDESVIKMNQWTDETDET